MSKGGGPVRTPRLWLYAIAFPLLCLVISWFQKPALLDFSYIGAPPPSRTEAGHRLFATDKTTVNFTDADLLKVNAGREPAMALLIDLYPKLEGSSNPEGPAAGSVSNSGLTWTSLIVRRIQALAMEEAAKADLIDKFAAQFRGAPRLGRGAITQPIFLVDQGSPLHREAGIRAIVGLGTRIPEKGQFPPEAANLPTRYETAVLTAFEEIAKSGVRTIAIPFIPLAEKVTKEPPNSRDSWHRLLKAVLEAIRTHPVDTVLIGAYGLNERNQERLHADFVGAWTDFRGSSLPKAPSALHEALRMGMVALIGMLLAAWWEGRQPSLRGLLVVVVASTLIASSLAGLFTWLEPFTSDVLPATVIVCCKFAAALIAGFFARQLLSFDAKKELSA